MTNDTVVGMLVRRIPNPRSSYGTWPQKLSFDLQKPNESSEEFTISIKKRRGGLSQDRIEGEQRQDQTQATQAPRSDSGDSAPGPKAPSFSSALADARRRPRPRSQRATWRRLSRIARRQRRLAHTTASSCVPTEHEFNSSNPTPYSHRTCLCFGPAGTSGSGDPTLSVGSPAAPPHLSAFTLSGLLAFLSAQLMPDAAILRIECTHAALSSKLGTVGRRICIPAYPCTCASMHVYTHTDMWPAGCGRMGSTLMGLLQK